MDTLRTSFAVVLLIVGVNLSTGHHGWWAIVGGGLLGGFAGMATRR